MGARTFVIGDVHGDLQGLEVVLGRLPKPTRDDTLVFLGDYVDRGPDSKGVVARVRRLAKESPVKTVLLRGNHEDKWVQSWEKADLPYLVQVGNGCASTFRSFSGGAALGPDESLPIEELQRMLDVKSWLPADVAEWMAALPLYYEDEHALYVHAGVERDGDGWKHPRDTSPKVLMWMREPDFYRGYRGKRLCFGHTPITELPIERVDDENRAWISGDLVGLDTGAGKGGYLTAIELPSMTLYTSI